MLPTPRRLPTTSARLRNIIGCVVNTLSPVGRRHPQVQDDKVFDGTLEAGDPRAVWDRDLVSKQECCALTAASVPPPTLQAGDLLHVPRGFVHSAGEPGLCGVGI